MSGLTATHINQIRAAAGASGGIVIPAADIATLFNEAMTKHGGGQFTTKQRVAALLSECLMESAYFRTTVEYSNTGRYQPYRGRTFIQLTWKSNYQQFGAWCLAHGLLTKTQGKNYFANHPIELGRAPWAVLGGVFYFTTKKWGGKTLCQIADNGNPLQIGRAVNLGNPYSKATPNGQAARDKAYELVMSLPDSIVPGKPKHVIHVTAGKNKGHTYRSPKTVSVHWINDRRSNGQFSRHIWFLQHWLNMAGYPYGACTGFWDSKTQNLYDRFRRDAGYRGAAAQGAVGVQSLTKLRAKAHATKKISA